MKLTKLHYRLIIQLEILILTGLLGFFIFQICKSNPSISEAISLATTVKPETFTELYFENHNQLPNTISQGQTYTYSFTIHNLENKDMEYHYAIYGQRNGQKVFEDFYTINIKKDEFKTINDTVGPLKNLQTKMVVELTDQNQQISFLMNGEDNTISPISSKKVPMVEETITQSQQYQKSYELYFDPYRTLPFLSNLNETIDFAFIIHNLNKNSTYKYMVYMNNNGQITQIDNNQIELKQNESKTVTVSHTITNQFNQAKIYVKLIDKNDYIYFFTKQKK